jgi:hypothetical protein
MTEHKTSPPHDESNRERQRISTPAPKPYEQATMNPTPFSVAQEQLAALQRIEALLLRQLERQKP